MRKIVASYPLQIEFQNFSSWNLPLPFGAEVVGFAQIGAMAFMFVLEDFSEGPLPREERVFLTVPVGRQFEAPERLKFLGSVLLVDNSGVMSTLRYEKVAIPLVIFEVLPVKEHPAPATIH